MHRNKICSAFFVMVSVLLHSQAVIPKLGKAFNDGEVAIVYISIHPDSLADLYENENLFNDHEYPADFIWQDQDGLDTVKNIGFRLRGNTSRLSAKKSFKIKFDHFGGRKFEGLTDLNLNGEHNDPTICRSKLSWDIYRMALIEGPRANHVKLYINGQYMGLYMNVENIDARYFKVRKKDDQGQLFKCYYGADFVYKGNNPNQYSKQIYEPKNNIDEPDYSQLIAFLKALNDIDNPEFRCNLEKIFEVDAYLKIMALEMLIGHWDNPIYNTNNAYLYFNPEKQKFELLSFDLDNTFGIDWIGLETENRNPYLWSPQNQKRPIYTHLLRVEEYRKRLGYYLEKYIKDFFNPNNLNPKIDAIKSMIEPHRVLDEFASYDYGYSYQDFQKSYTKALGAHVTLGLKEYIGLRSSSIINQLEVRNIGPIIQTPKISWNDRLCTFQWFVTSPSIEQVTVQYKFKNDVAITKDLVGIPDETTGGQIYTFELPYTGKTTVALSFTAVNNFNQRSTWPTCNEFEIDLGYDAVPRLFINEFMADNTLIKDDNNEFEDWIEIYNAEPFPVYLGDKYLTDDADIPNKWLMPNIDIEPYQFLVFWADEDQEQGSLHTNFKLSKEGEFIGIFDAAFNNLAPIDTLSYGSTLKNKSIGRTPDGFGLFTLLNEASPGTSNQTTSLVEVRKPMFSIHPNPANAYIKIDGLHRGNIVSIFGLEGKLFNRYTSKHDNEVRFDVSFLQAGVYKVTVQDGVHFSHRLLIINK